MSDEPHEPGDELREQLREVGGRRAEARAAHERTTEELRRLVPQAVDAGLSVAEVARLLSLSREGVYKLAGRR